MIPHPLVLAVIFTALAATLLFVAAVAAALAVLLGWHPEAASKRQLLLERRAEVASLLARAGALLFVASTAMTLFAIAGVLPGIVPGAMCGTGVMQALGPAGERLLLVRGVAAAALYAWFVLDSLNRSCPTAPITQGAARALVLAAPALLLAEVDTISALGGLNLQLPVDCCTAVYASSTTAGGVSWGRLGLTSSQAIWLTLGGAALLVAGTVGATRSRRLAGLTAVAVPLALAWVFFAGFTLVDSLAAYHYGVLAHDCPWCLFAARHRLVGYPLFGALAVVALEALALTVATLTAGRAPELAPAAGRRARTATWRLVGAVGSFLALALGPALVWRLRHGVWIEG